LFVFFANAPGLMISVWLNIGAMKLQYYDEIIKYSSIQTIDGGQAGETTEEGSGNETQPSDEGESADGTDGNNCQKSPPSLTAHEWILLEIVAIWVVILSTTSLLPINKDSMKFVVGVCVNANLIFFYAAPLSTIMTVLRTKSSASIHLWTMTMNTTNAFFWCVYSLAIQDYYILIPNGLGFAFGLLQTILYKIYPHTAVPESDDGTEQFLDDDGNSRESATEMII